MIQIKIDLTSKQKIFIISAIFLGLVAIISIWIIAPAIKDIYSLNQRIYEQRLALEKRYVQRFSMRRIIANFREINENMDEILSITLSQSEVIAFITILEKKADKNNINLKIDLLPQEKDKYPDKKQIFDLTLITEGTFKNTLSFINDIEKLNTYILLDSISLTQKNKDTKEIINGSLKGYVYKNINF